MSIKVLLASRLHEEEDATAEAAARLADRIGGELMLVYVAVELSTIPQLQAATGENADSLRERMIAEIEAKARSHLERYAPGVRTRVLLTEGYVVEQIARVAREERVGYLVIGTEGRSTLRQVILGSTAQKIIQAAPCPVLVVPQKPGPSGR